jgi:Cytidylate kinase-like family
VSCRAVCISRPEGAGGARVGQLVSERLGFLYIDEEIVARAAVKGGISPGDVADEERRKSALGRLLKEIGGGAVAESYAIAGPAAPRAEGPTPDAIRGLIRDAIEELASEGNVVIVAHAASLALSQRSDVLRVLVTASPETRAERISESRGLGAKEAEKTIKSADAARADYLRRFYGVGSELPTHYDLVVNTDVLSVEQAADLVAQAAG